MLELASQLTIRLRVDVNRVANKTAHLYTRWLFVASVCCAKRAKIEKATRAIKIVVGPHTQTVSCIARTQLL